VVLRYLFCLITVQISAYILLIKTEPLSETILFDILNLEMTLLTKLLANSFTFQDFSVSMYKDILEKWFTITRIVLYTALLFLLGSRLVIKSIEISCQELSRTGSSCNIL
jgi:hypothetical protein